MTVTKLRSWAIEEPAAQRSLDFIVASLRMTPSEILAHQIEPGVEQIERRAERLGNGHAGRSHDGSPALAQFARERRRCLHERSKRAHAGTLRVSERAGKHSGCATEPVDLAEAIAAVSAVSHASQSYERRLHLTNRFNDSTRPCRGKVHEW